MAKETGVVVEGVVAEVLGDDKFKITLDNGSTVIGYISGRLRKNHIRVLPADRVQVEVSLYDLTRGRIVYRFK